MAIYIDLFYSYGIFPNSQYQDKIKLKIIFILLKIDIYVYHLCPLIQSIYIFFVFFPKLI